MDQAASTPSSAAGCLSQFGLAVVVACATLSGLMVTAAVPPWVKVKCQKRELLYWSQQEKVLETTFVGFDFVLSGAKWKSGPRSATSGQLFTVTEYQIFWPLLVGEWLTLLVAGGYVFVLFSRRIRRADDRSGGPGVRDDAVDRPAS